MRRPTGHTLLGPSSAPGLGDLLAGRHDFQPKAYELDLAGLSFIPAGEVSAPPSELLGGPAARSLLETLRTHYDVIFVDSPPVLAVPDAVTLAPLCDAALTVVAAGRTDRPQLAQTQGALAAVGTRVTGVILTHFNTTKSGSSYRYPSYGYTRANES
ncbi:MAG: CpsD/CapB family tyrosine-protein kinase [Rhodothermaceae bacterium]|nr:CpsD/CapB family tyrosine-protein kinase [Rhodothermaceae bacterium]